MEVSSRSPSLKSDRTCHLNERWRHVLLAWSPFDDLQLRRQLI
jgi:hypothetical protein